MPGPRIQLRKMKHAFDESIPKHWFGGNAVASHLVNGVNLLFPRGERFFIRSVKHFLDDIRDDSEMVERVRAFFGQEGHHAREHERWFEVLQAQGYDIDDFLDRYERWSVVIERAMSPELRLAVTAASEHFTAIMAEAALTVGFLEAVAHPTLTQLLLWHASEEIEHKSVAYDVLQKVNPSYSLRVRGLVVATVVLGGWWLTATRSLLRQDGLSFREQRAQMRSARAFRRRLQLELGKKPMPDLLHGVFLRGIREYLRRDFHPDDNDNYHLAERYLAKRERASA